MTAKQTKLGATLLPRRKPGMKCKICQRPDRERIDAAIVIGKSLNSIAVDCGISPSSVQRHRDKCLAATLAKAAPAVAAAEIDHGTNLAASAAQLRDKALSILAKAERAGDLKTALIGVREAARCVDLLGRVTGDLDTGITLNVAVAPSLTQLQQAILLALGPFPEARRAVVSALSGTSDAPLLEHDP
jgi:hypothetical protein